MPRRRGPRPERGAAAVELAIVLPFLLLVLGGIVDLSRFMYTNMVIGSAAREGVRTVAMGDSISHANSRVDLATSTLPGGASVSRVYTTCPSGDDNARLRLTYTNFEWLLLGPVTSMFGFTGPTAQPTGVATMRCGG